jgi:hypothetical protein
MLCIIYPVFFYFSLVVIYPCDGTPWNFTLNLCGLANCFLVYNRILAVVDWAIDGGLPLIVISIANMSLVIRVVRQKHRRQQMISWQKQRHMTLQLLSISCLYLIGWFPNTIFAIIYNITKSNVVAKIHLNYIYELLFLVCLFIPWVSIRMLPGFKKWIFQRIHQQSMLHNTVAPTRMRLTVIG